MDPMTIMLLSTLGSAAVSGIKSELVDKPEFERQERLRANDVRYSPWVEMRSVTEKRPSALEGVLGGIGHGMAIGQSLGGSLGGAKASPTLPTPAPTPGAKIDLSGDEMMAMSPREKSRWLMLSEQMNQSPTARSYWESLRT